MSNQRIEFIKERLKFQKNELLKISDWVAMPDVKLAEGLKEEIIDWRNKLRTADDDAGEEIWTKEMEESGVLFSVFDVADLSDEACAVLKIVKNFYR